MRKELALLALPFITLLSTSCSRTPDVADYLKTQCELNPNLEVASQWIEMVPGQRVDMLGHGFELNRFGKLNRTDIFADKFIEVGEGYITKDWFGKGRYHFILLNFSNLEQGNKTALNVSCNCSDVK
ncbi:MAG: hypothetical protein WCV81_04450 [Microgenomates group bacterium]|jgi:hypothetical protein